MKLFGKKSRKKEKRMQEDFEEADRKKKDDEAVSEIFSRCLRDVLAPELWLVYVNYAKATNENGLARFI